MTWFFVAVASYFILAGVNVVDKLILASLVPSPRVYAFYVGLLSSLAVLLIPFVGFYFPGAGQTLLALAAGAAFILAILWLYKGLQLFEASRVVPAVGGLVPLFGVVLIYVFSLGAQLLPYEQWPAFVLLLTGTVLITLNPQKSVTFRSLKISAIAALLFALSFVLSGYVYLVQPFWNGFIMMKLGGLAPVAALFFFSSEVRAELFRRRATFRKKTIGVVVANQAAGAGANILQNLAIALSPLAFVPVIGALQGTQYVFLLALAVLLSLKFPKLLKEEISARVLGQKAAAVALIALGTVLFFFK